MTPNVDLLQGTGGQLTRAPWALRHQYHKFTWNFLVLRIELPYKENHSFLSQTGRGLHRKFTPLECGSLLAICG
jgi:hypothetical protein